MALGLEELEPVDMLVGAGNAYVAEAKRQLFGRVGIDLLAGPDRDPRNRRRVRRPGAGGGRPARAGRARADLAGGARDDLARRRRRRCTQQVERLLGSWPTRELAGAAWEACGEIVVAAGRGEALELANGYAAEHVEVHAEEGELDAYLAGLRNYGSLFLGADATVVYGDKAVGTNHVLPTAGAARYTGGLWVGKFLKTVTYQRLTAEGTRRVAPAAAAISDAERFAGHALTARMRLERLEHRA